MLHFIAVCLKVKQKEKKIGKKLTLSKIMSVLRSADHWLIISLYSGLIRYIGL